MFFVHTFRDFRVDLPTLFVHEGMGHGNVGGYEAPGERIVASAPHDAAL